MACRSEQKNMCHRYGRTSRGRSRERTCGGRPARLCVLLLNSVDFQYTPKWMDGYTVRFVQLVQEINVTKRALCSPHVCLRFLFRFHDQVKNLVSETDWHMHSIYILSRKTKKNKRTSIKQSTQKMNKHNKHILSRLIRGIFRLQKRQQMKARGKKFFFRTKMNKELLKVQESKRK